MSIDNIEKHAAVLEGIEKISYYLVWSRIEEANLVIPFDAHDQLELVFIQLYTTILTFTARSLRFLRNKPGKYTETQYHESCTNVDPDRIGFAFFSPSSEFQDNLD